MHRAATRLIHTPAPDASALLAKLEIILTNELGSVDDSAAYPWSELRQDLRLHSQYSSMRSTLEPS